MRAPWIALAVVTAVITARTAPAQPAPQPVEAISGEVDSVVIEPDDKAWREARNAELASRRHLCDEEVARLSAGIGDGASAAGSFAIQRNIARVKEVAELDLLEIQARYARLAGRVDVALQVEQVVAARRERLRVEQPATAARGQ